MGDYKRLVSYMYNYDNGIKRNNIGYSRVESNNGRCKVTIRIKVANMNEENLKVYFFKRNGYSIEGILLGEFTIKRGLGQFVTLTDSDNIMDSTYELDDIGGIVLYYTEKKYFATEWDDKPVTKEMVNEGLLMSSKADFEGKKISKKNSTDNEHKEQKLQEIEEFKEVKESLERSEEKLVSETSKTNDLQVKKDDYDNQLNKQVTIEKEDIEEELEEDMIVEQEESSGNVDHVTVNNELKEDKNDNLVELAEDVFKEISSEKVDPKKVFEYKEVNKVNQDLYDKTYRKSQQPTRSTNKRSWKTFEEHPDALKIYNKYPKMYPFEDNEVAWCVRFEPQDIGVLPIDNWSLGNNSFLLHGFYCYSHLIFARINDKSGIQYILGVPGIYHNREKFMAKMFGFNFFKSIKRKELRIGEFGYWYAPIYFN